MTAGEVEERLVGSLLPVPSGAEAAVLVEPAHCPLDDLPDPAEAAVALAPMGDPRGWEQVCDLGQQVVRAQLADHNCVRRMKRWLTANQLLRQPISPDRLFPLPLSGFAP
jgi:hypothetical protein